MQVYYRKVESGERTLLWSKDGKQGRQWLRESYSLRALDKAYEIEFVAIRGGGDGIVISLDDITVNNGTLLLYIRR